MQVDSTKFSRLATYDNSDDIFVETET